MTGVPIDPARAIDVGEHGACGIVEPGTLLRWDSTSAASSGRRPTRPWRHPGVGVTP